MAVGAAVQPCLVVASSTPQVNGSGENALFLKFSETAGQGLNKSFNISRLKTKKPKRRKTQNHGTVIPQEGVEKGLEPTPP
ncbi:MAG: hypothetical protein QXQ70_09485, partial [Candidatus Caldarchaeum sp.]